MTDTPALVAASTLWLITLLALYVWTALALSAVFRKSGEQGWQAWVPVLNAVVLFRLGGLSGWLVLLYLIPVLGWAAQIVACHRINVSFGYGAGMTVLSALLFPVWASVVGFSSAGWVGREGGPRRSAPVETTSHPPMRSGAPRTLPSPAAPPEWPPVPPAGYAPTRRSTATSADADAAPRPAAPGAVPSSVVPPAGGWSPPPLPPVGARRQTADVGWDDLERHLEATGAREITGAVPGAPGPISALPFSSPPSDAAPSPLRAPVGSVPAASGYPDIDEDTSDPGITAAPRRAAAPDADHSGEPPPGPRRGGALRSSWAPSEADGFAETSGPVSAVAGAPAAGVPRSALSSVSAQTPRAEIPEDPLDRTVIARRRRTDWSLVRPTGDPVVIGSDVVLVGRRPAPDPEYPGAQLVSIDDGTVSKTHARLELRDDVWYVTDLYSTNGIVFATVLGTEVEVTPGVEIEAGDRFLLGDAEIRLVRSRP